MNEVKYYTVAAVEHLRANVVDRLDWYFRPERDSADALLSAGEGVRRSRLTMPDIAAGLQWSVGRPGEVDAQNALWVYECLPTLTRQQASDERLWAFLCHVECAQYVAARWLHSRPEDEQKAVRKVRSHFFARGNRALIRDNGLSRLWWLGFIAHTVEKDDPHAFLSRLLHRQDVRSGLIERPSVSMNRDVLAAINEVMRDYWKRDRSLFERERFRAWMRNLNRRGGVVLLDALPHRPLARLVADEALRALSAP